VRSFAARIKKPIEIIAKSAISINIISENTPNIDALIISTIYVRGLR